MYNYVFCITFFLSFFVCFHRFLWHLFRWKKIIFVVRALSNFQMVLYDLEAGYGRRCRKYWKQYKILTSRLTVSMSDVQGPPYVSVSFKQLEYLRKLHRCVTCSILFIRKTRCFFIKCPRGKKERKKARFDVLISGRKPSCNLNGHVAVRLFRLRMEAFFSRG